MDLMVPEEVLANLKEIKAHRELNDEEMQLGRIAAQMFAQNLHQQTVAALEDSRAQEIKRLVARGYEPSEAADKIAREERWAGYSRGFCGPLKRCRIGSVERSCILPN